MKKQQTYIRIINASSCPHGHVHACERASATIWGMERKKEKDFNEKRKCLQTIFRAVANINVKIKLQNVKRKKRVFSMHTEKSDERKIDN